MYKPKAGSTVEKIRGEKISNMIVWIHSAYSERKGMICYGNWSQDLQE